MYELVYHIDYNNLHIVDSYKVRKCKMREELETIRAYTEPGETIVFDRSMFSLKMEWIVHNFLYKIHFMRSRTKDVDLNNPCGIPEWIYIVCGLLTWVFVW